MKKVLSIVLCLTICFVICFTVLTGCDTLSDPKQETSFTSMSEQAQESTSASASEQAQESASASAPEQTQESTSASAPGPTQEKASASESVATPVNAGYLFTEDNFPRIDGSTATIPLIQAVTAALLGNSRSGINVNVSKTSGAYVALMQNNADILLVYDGGDETREQVNADELFETIPIGKDALVFLVNRDNPIENLTTQQVQKIFSGEYTNWSELGGGDEPIRAYQRGVGSGSQALMDKLVMPGLTMADPAKVTVVESMGGLIEAVADFDGGPLGIGYNVFFYVTEMRGNDYIKILSIDGVAPSYETIQSGEYPFVSDFYSVIRKNEPAGSPARALHEWMQTDEAQNLIASENYVALSANPSANTPYVDSSFSPYKEGEAPKYFEGVNPYVFEARDDYERLYFYLGAIRASDWDVSRFYGLCTADGRIVTEPVYSVALMLTDSNGEKAYFCYRSDKEPFKDIVTYENGSYEVNRYPAMLFSLDGSWVKEFDSATPFSGLTATSEAIRNADVLAVMRDGKWGAVNMNGETVVPFDRDGSDGIYPPNGGDIEGFALAVTADRFMLLINEIWLYDLYDASGNMIASELHGMPLGMAGEFIVAYDWVEGIGATAYTYTFDGELIASLALDEGDYAEAIGDYVCVYSNSRLTTYDRKFNILHEFSYEYDQELGFYMRRFLTDPSGLYSSDRETFLHHTYLPDGTRLVSWYDPEMS